MLHSFSRMYDFSICMIYFFDVFAVGMRWHRDYYPLAMRSDIKRNAIRYESHSQRILIATVPLSTRAIVY